MIFRVLSGILALALVTSPSNSHAKPNKDHQGGYEQKGKVKYYDGRCIVEQKFKKHGDFVEKRKCRY